MSILDFAVLVFASLAIVRVWFKGSIFAGARASLEAWEPRTWFGEWARGLLQCAFCFSYWSPIPLLALFAASLLVSEPWTTIIKLPIYSLAITSIIYTLSVRLGLEKVHASA